MIYLGKIWEFTCKSTYLICVMHLTKKQGTWSVTSWYKNAYDMVHALGITWIFSILICKMLGLKKYNLVKKKELYGKIRTFKKKKQVT